MSRPGASKRERTERRSQAPGGRARLTRVAPAPYHAGAASGRLVAHRAGDDRASRPVCRPAGSPKRPPPGEAGCHSSGRLSPWATTGRRDRDETFTIRGRGGRRPARGHHRVRGTGERRDRGHRRHHQDRRPRGADRPQRQVRRHHLQRRRSGLQGSQRGGRDPRPHDRVRPRGRPLPGVRGGRRGQEAHPPARGIHDPRRRLLEREPRREARDRGRRRSVGHHRVHRLLPHRSGAPPDLHHHARGMDGELRAGAVRDRSRHEADRHRRPA